MGKILIKNGRIWDGEKFFFSDILTDGKIIEKIGVNINADADFVYDATGKYVSAGLIDIHTHLLGISVDAFGVGADISSLPFGVTCVFDAGAVYGNDKLLNSFEVNTFVFVPVVLNKNLLDEEATEERLKKYGQKVKGIKLCFDLKENPNYNIEVLKSVCNFAKSKGLRVMVHTTNSLVSMEQIIDVLSEGDLITHAFHGGKNNCTENDFYALRLAKDKGVIIDCGFAGGVHTDFKVLKKAIENGFFPDTISSDITKLSAFKRGGRYGLTLCMSMAKNVGISEEEIFKCVTSRAARSLGIDNVCGFLKEGKTADISVLDYTDDGFFITDLSKNVLESDKGYRCLLTILNGKIVYRD